MENSSVFERTFTQEEEEQFLEFKRAKKAEEARAKVGKLECDCLSPYTEKSTLSQLCKDGDRLALGAIVVLPSLVRPCVGYLGGDPKCGVIAAISYPHGGDETSVKVAAVKRAVKDGADEMEVTAPVIFLRDGNFAYFKRECKKLRRAAKTRALRMVFDVNSLKEEILVKACAVAADAGTDCVRINGNADGALVKRVKSAVKDKCIVKVEGVETVSGFDTAVDFGAGVVSSRCAVDLASLIISSANSV